MYRILFSAILTAGVWHTAGAQSSDPSVNIKGVSPLASAPALIEKLRPQSNIIKLPDASFAYQYSLSLQSTKTVIPQAISVETTWTAQGKSSYKALNFETIDYVQLVPLLVAAVQGQQAQIVSLTKEIDALKKELTGE